jgi:hypothetical protein
MIIQTEHTTRQALETRRILLQESIELYTDLGDHNLANLSRELLENIETRLEFMDIGDAK